MPFSRLCVSVTSVMPASNRPHTRAERILYSIGNQCKKEIRDTLLRRWFAIALVNVSAPSILIVHNNIKALTFIWRLISIVEHFFANDCRRFWWSAASCHDYLFPAVIFSTMWAMAKLPSIGCASDFASGELATQKSISTNIYSNPYAGYGAVCVDVCGWERDIYGVWERSDKLQNSSLSRSFARNSNAQHALLAHIYRFSVSSPSNWVFIPMQLLRTAAIQFVITKRVEMDEIRPIIFVHFSVSSGLCVCITGDGQKIAQSVYK